MSLEHLAASSWYFYTIALHESILEASCRTKDSLNNVATACAKAGLMNEAAKYYALALKVDPKYESALRNLAKLRLQQKEYDQSIALLAVCLKSGGAIPRRIG